MARERDEAEERCVVAEARYIELEDSVASLRRERDVLAARAGSAELTRERDRRPHRREPPPPRLGPGCQARLLRAST